MWNEKLSGSREHHQGTVKTTVPNGNRCHLTAGELEFLDAGNIFNKAVEVEMPMKQAQPLVSAANRLRGHFQDSDRVPGYAGFVPVPTNLKVDLTAMERIMDLGGFPVSDIPEHESPAQNKIIG